jgi:hypothetical protein
MMLDLDSFIVIISISRGERIGLAHVLMMMIAPIICAVVEALGKLWMIASTTHEQHHLPLSTGGSGRS